MNSYKIVVEDMKCNMCAKRIREALESLADDVVVTANVAKKEVIVDSNLSVEEIYSTIEEAGYTPSDLDLL